MWPVAKVGDLHFLQASSELTVPIPASKNYAWDAWAGCVYIDYMYVCIYIYCVYSIYTRATQRYTLNCVTSVWNQPSLASSCISPSGGPPAAACTRCRVARSSMASSRLCCGHRLQSEGSNFCPTSRGRTLLGRRAGVSAHRNSTRLTSVDDYFSPARLDYS